MNGANKTPTSSQESTASFNYYILFFNLAVPTNFVKLKAKAMGILRFKLNAALYSFTYFIILILGLATLVS